MISLWGATPLRFHVATALLRIEPTAFRAGSRAGRSTRCFLVQAGSKPGHEPLLGEGSVPQLAAMFVDDDAHLFADLVDEARSLGVGERH